LARLLAKESCTAKVVPNNKTPQRSCMTWLLAHQPILLAISVAAGMWTNIGNAIITTINVEQKIEQRIEARDEQPRP
jgi:fructose-specific phosphotransferase system IIC component